MHQSADLKVDVAVVGGGLQGLFVLKELLRRNYSAVLFSKGALGAGQTSHAHAFLHEGHMFRRADNVKQAQSSYSEWRTYLDEPGAKAWEGDFYFGDIDPSEFQKHSAIWNQNISGLATTKSCEAPSHFTSRLTFWRGRGTCLNTPQLVERLARDYEPHIGLVDRLITLDGTPERVLIEAHNSRGEPIRVEARTVVAAAGVGNQDILGLCGNSPLRQQTVKAHMLAVRSAELEPLAGFFRPMLERKAMFIAPRVLDGATVWLISDGNHEMVSANTPDRYRWPPDETSAWVRQVVESLTQLCEDEFGSANRHRLEWAVYCAAKAEIETPRGWMPEGPEYHYVREKSTCVVWPTLLTHIPRASREIALKTDWFSGPMGTLAPADVPKWREWKCRPEVAVELWRTLHFQTWDKFRVIHSLE